MILRGWVWPPGILTVPSSQTPLITVCRHFGAWGRKRRCCVLCCSAAEPGIARPAVVLPSQCGWALVSALWAERRRILAEPGITRIRPSQCGAGRCSESLEGAIDVCVSATTAAAAPAVCNVAWLYSQGGRAPSPGRPGWWTQTKWVPSGWSWTVPPASAETQQTPKDERQTKWFLSIPTLASHIFYFNFLFFF